MEILLITPMQILLFAIPGVIGGLVRGLVGVYKNVIVSKKPFSVAKIIFSLIVAIIVGAFAGFISQGNIIIAMLAGYAGTDFIEAMAKSRLISKFKL